MERECCVCGEPLDGDNVSRCNLCGGDFHMAWSTKASVKECGHYRFTVKRAVNQSWNWWSGTCSSPASR